MNTIGRVMLGLSLALSAAARGGESVAAAASTAPAGPTAEKLVAQLDDPDYKVRSAADLQLNNLPGSALGVVESTLKDDTISAESRVRLESAVRILRPRARDELRQRQASEWADRIWREGYHKPGRAAAAYDRAVDEAIAAFAKLSPRPEVMRPEPDRDKVAAMLKLVLDQGCDDLYVQCLYWAARGNRAPLKDAVKGQRQFIEFMDGPYDAGLK